MIPTLAELGVLTPAYIRKINKKAHWDPEGCNGINERVQLVVEKVFKQDEYSVWKVATDSEFYGVIASLTANKHPKNCDIDFIWIAESDFNTIGIQLRQLQEGKCECVEHLHFNIKSEKSLAEDLCRSLFEQDRQAIRCRKKQTELILDYQKSLGCRATDSKHEMCNYRESI
jgi:hypothetical protein